MQPARSGKGPYRESLHAAAAARIVQVASRAECTPQELANLARGDPAFALRLLAITNSSAFGLRHRVTDVRHAAQLLGVRGLRNIALSLVVQELAPPGPFGTAVLALSLRRACAARSLAQALRRPVEEAFTAGLLLETGLLASGVGEEVGLQIAQASASQRVLRERLCGLRPHPQRGAELAVELGLPEPIVRAIELHHDANPPVEPLAAIAWAAERVAGLYESADVAGAREALKQAAAGIGLDAATVDQIACELPERLGEQSQIFDRDLGEQPNIETLTIDAHRALLEINREYELLVRALEQAVAEKDRLMRELAETNARLERLATTDPLTGLANKRALETSLLRDLAVADRASSWLSVVALDLDHFKKLNDMHGHATGDEALRVVANVLRQGLRAGDLAARVGGEELLTLLPNTDPAGAAVVAERLRRGIELARFEGPRGVVSVTASIGTASIKGPGCREAASRLFAEADRALYEAKHTGRNRVCHAA